MLTQVNCLDLIQPDLSQLLSASPNLSYLHQPHLTQLIQLLLTPLYSIRTNPTFPNLTQLTSIWPPINPLIPLDQAWPTWLILTRHHHLATLSLSWTPPTKPNQLHLTWPNLIPADPISPKINWPHLPLPDLTWLHLTPPDPNWPFFTLLTTIKVICWTALLYNNKLGQSCAKLR